MLPTWFAYGVALMELAACLAFVVQRDWRMAILWGGYTVAAFALAGVR